MVRMAFMGINIAPRILYLCYELQVQFTAFCKVFLAESDVYFTSELDGCSYSSLNKQAESEVLPWPCMARINTSDLLYYHRFILIAPIFTHEVMWSYSVVLSLHVHYA